MFRRRKSSADLRKLQLKTAQAKADSDRRKRYAEYAYQAVMDRCHKQAAYGNSQADCTIEYEGSQGGNDDLMPYILTDVLNRLRSGGFRVHTLTNSYIRVSW